MAMKYLLTVKKEEVSFFPPSVKEESFESEVWCPVTKQEEAKFSCDLLKQEPLNTYKKEEPFDWIATPPLEITAKQEGEEHLVSQHEKNAVPDLESTEDNVPPQRMQLRYRICRGKSGPAPLSLGHSREEICTPRTPLSSPCRLESEGDDTNDSDRRARTPIQAVCTTHLHQTPRRSRRRPQKNPAVAEVDCKRRSKKRTKVSRCPSSSTDRHIVQRGGRKPRETGAESTTLGKPRRSLCETCGKAFLSTRDLKRHELTHTGDKPFSCGVCGRRFNDRGNMRKHAALHSGEQPYHCVLCGRGFSERGNLLRHEFYVHDVPNEGSRRSYEPLWHQCPTCLRRFKYHRSLLRHVDSWCQRNRKGKETNGKANAGKREKQSQSGATE